MSTFDYPSLARSVPLPLSHGLLAGAPLASSADRTPPNVSGAPSSPQSDAHDRVDPLDAPSPDVARLHNEAERSMLSSSGSPPSAGSAASPAGVVKPAARELHRVRAVRREQGISIKRASQHLGVSVEEARRQEEPTCDLSLAQLHAWQKLCEVPVADLLVEPDCDLSAPVLQRARMVRVMKTVQAILERTGQQSVKRLGQTLVNQLVELMPELKGVSSWHAVERRHSQNQNARILESNYLRPEEEPRD